MWKAYCGHAKNARRITPIRRAFLLRRPRVSDLPVPMAVFESVRRRVRRKLQKQGANTRGSLWRLQVRKFGLRPFPELPVPEPALFPFHVFAGLRHASPLQLIECPRSPDIRDDTAHVQKHTTTFRTNASNWIGRTHLGTCCCRQAHFAGLLNSCQVMHRTSEAKIGGGRFARGGLSTCCQFFAFRRSPLGWPTQDWAGESHKAKAITR